MIQRLRDLPDPVEPEYGAAREFLRQVERLPDSPAQAERVLAAIRLRGAAPAPRPTPLLTRKVFLSLAVAAALVLAVTLYLLRRQEPQPAASAGAEREERAVRTPAPNTAQAPQPPVVAPRIDAVPAAIPQTTEPKRSPSPASGGGRAGAARAQRAADVVLAQPSPSSPAASGKAADDPSLLEPTPGQDAPPAPPPPSPVEVNEAADPEEAALVLSAIQALRQRKQPAHALGLVSEYQRRFPSGALQEEALALRLECLVALADRRAAESAREYLTRYPRGRFRSFASAVVTRDRGAPTGKESP